MVNNTGSGLKNSDSARLCRYSLAPSDVIGALTGAGGETVIERVTERARGIRPGPAYEAGGGGGLVHLTAIAPTLPHFFTSEPGQAGVRIQTAGAAVIQLV